MNLSKPVRNVSKGVRKMRPIMFSCLCLLVLVTAAAPAVYLADSGRQGNPAQIVVRDQVTRNDLYAVKIDNGAVPVLCRTVPFLAAQPERRGHTRRIIENTAETIPIGTSAETLYLLGMINEGWDYGVAHWGYHPELQTKRTDQVYIGSRIGEIEIRYAGAASDRIPLVIGATAWFVAQWAHGPTHNVKEPVKEPFASRPEFAAVLEQSLRIREDPRAASNDTRHIHYFLAVKPRNKLIESIVIHDNPDLRGRPLVSAITVAGAKPADRLEAFGRYRVDASDLKPAIKAATSGDWSKDLEALANILYTSESDLPKKVKLIDFPDGLDATRIRFIGGTKADMLSNMWVANLTQMDEKFKSDTGYFHETGPSCPWYGGYYGIGTWAPIGVYRRGAWARCAEHYGTVALRCINDPRRTTTFVDFCDKWLYYHRTNHDPDKGPPNDDFDVKRYPVDAPPHWNFPIDGPLPFGVPAQVNEIPGAEVMDGQGAAIVARWVAWRLMGAPKGKWLTAPRKDIYGKSRWDSTRDATEFICWLMDYTGRDVIWSEGELTGWGGWGHLIPRGMAKEPDPAKIRRNYANADMYEPYPTYACLTALRCSAQIAEATGDTKRARRWRDYADRLQAGMIRLLAVGDRNFRTWRVSPYSILPSFQDSLVQAWFSIYLDGLDPQRLHPEMTQITRNTLKRQLNQPYGHAPVLGMGYGIGWLTKTTLILDEMDDAGPLLVNIARYCYDKNMNYADEKRGIDWRKWLWLIPEGTNILPDGRWYRICDLSNGANQGITMHALELCAGVDDTDPHNLKIIPRVPEPLTGIEVSNFFVLVPEGKGLATARISYRYEKNTQFSLKSNRPLPTFAVRFGPFAEKKTARRVLDNTSFPTGSTQRIEASGRFKGKDAWWLWVEGLRNVKEIEISFVK